MVNNPPSIKLRQVRIESDLSLLLAQFSFSSKFKNSAFLQSNHGKERFYPSLICPAQPGRITQESNLKAVRIRVIILCGLNQAVDHSAGLGTSRSWLAKNRFFRPITKGFMLRSARLLESSSLFRILDGAPDKAIAPAGSAVPCPGRT